MATAVKQVKRDSSDYAKITFLKSLSDLLYHMYTIFLFTASDLKTIVLPSTVFGIIGCYSRLTQDPNMPGQEALQRIPHVLLWTWLNLLPFNISNQRQPDAVEEDLINKPWRPLPSGRLTPRQATALMLIFYSLALAVSVCLHGLRPCLFLMALGWWYNDCSGAENCGTRNLINAAGYLSFTYGAFEVAVGSQAHLNEKAYRWFFLIGMIVFSTVQIQDIQDQEGDRARGRKTIPLVIGDMPARWSIALLLPFWSLLASAFWQLRAVAYLLPLMLSVLISMRVLRRRAVLDDKISFRMWNAWILTVYVLPIMRPFES